MLKGITIKLYSSIKIGVDPFGNDVVTSEEHTVENALVAPVTCRLNPSSTSTTERILESEIAIPKGDTHVWEGAEVEFFGKRWKTVGSDVEGIEDMIPLDWHKKIKVERHEC